MKPKTINAIRNLAIDYEDIDLQVAYELISIAYFEKPNGEIIKSKYVEYKKRLEDELLGKKDFIQLFEKGEVVIIPIGFRCYTAGKIRDKLGIVQPSLPFNSGFFPPDAVASVLESCEINLRFEDEFDSHAVCIKNEFSTDPLYGKGIEFISSSYDAIDKKVINVEAKDFNKYLDSTFGYYTLDKKHNFVLAHYNWHALADDEKSQGIIDPKENLKRINKKLNSRISRMMRLCCNAFHIFFIYSETQNYNYMKIDEKYFFLNDFDRLNSVCKSAFGSKFSIINIDEVCNPKELLNKII